MKPLSNHIEPAISRPISVGEFPSVSIGLPTYNGGRRITTCIESIISQGYPNIELIISDNCSTDDTEAVCRAFTDRYPFIHYVRQERNIGITANFEFVLRKASGDLFMWISDDDSLELGILEKYVRFLLSHPGYSMVTGQIQYWSGLHRVFVERDMGAEKASRSARVMRYYRSVVHGAVFYGLMPREMAQKLPMQNRIGEDWHYVAKVAYLGKIRMLDCIGYHKKLNGTSRTFRCYVRAIGASWFSAVFSHNQIALDAFSDVVTSPVYKNLALPSRLMLAICSSAGILINHYTRYPFIVGGKILRWLGFKKRQRITPENTIEEEWAW